MSAKQRATHLLPPTPKRVEPLLLSIPPVTLGLRVGAQLGGVVLALLRQGQPKARRHHG